MQEFWLPFRRWHKIDTIRVQTFKAPRVTTKRSPSRHQCSVSSLDELDSLAAELTESSKLSTIVDTNLDGYHPVSSKYQ